LFIDTVSAVTENSLPHTITGSTNDLCTKSIRHFGGILNVKKEGVKIKTRKSENSFAEVIHGPFISAGVCRY